MSRNILYFGDNLHVLREKILDGSVDLVYLDPPFNSNRAYNVIFANQQGEEAKAQIRAFDDTWTWSPEVSELHYQDILENAPATVADAIEAMRRMLGERDLMAYLVEMTIRLLELHRVLKPTGTLYLHCDPVASHYLKILLDAIFGVLNFRSEIIWRRSSAHNKLSRQYGPIHDTILFYSKSGDFTFHPGRTAYPRSYIEGRFSREDVHGRYRQNELTGAGVRHGSSGAPWRGFDPTARGRHWAIPASLRELLPDEGQGMDSQQKLDYLAALPDGQIHVPGDPDGWPTYRQYIGEGVPYQDIWAYQPGTRGILWETEDGIDEDVRWLESGGERLGFETQKPVGVLRRIIETSSNPADVVLDPFCGCGTTVDAAQEMGRSWIGIDVTYLAIDLIVNRLQDRYGNGIVNEFDIDGIPEDLAGARAFWRNDEFEFERWAVTKIGAQPNKTQRGDKGVDGIGRFPVDRQKNGRVLVSVKGGVNLNPGMVRDLLGTVQTQRADLGVLITLEPPTRGMTQAAKSAGTYSWPATRETFPLVQIITVADLLEDKRPKLPPLFRPYVRGQRLLEPDPTLQLQLDVGG